MVYRKSKNITDTQRLNWLGHSENIYCDMVPQIDGDICVFGEWAKLLAGQPCEWVKVKSLRVAIDRAMEIEKSKKAMIQSNSPGREGPRAAGGRSRRDG